MLCTHCMCNETGVTKKFLSYTIKRDVYVDPLFYIVYMYLVFFILEQDSYKRMLKNYWSSHNMSIALPHNKGFSLKSNYL